MQDGCAVHNANIVRQYLHLRYPGQWIGNGGPIHWPPRSPDLTPLDYFLWPYLKEKVFKEKPTSLDNLREKIIQECNLIEAHVFENVRREFISRLYYCQEVAGAQFEPIYC